MNEFFEVAVNTLLRIGVVLAAGLGSSLYLRHTTMVTGERRHSVLDPKYQSLGENAIAHRRVRSMMQRPRGAET
jgi:hypothetical protein